MYSPPTSDTSFLRAVRVAVLFGIVVLLVLASACTRGPQPIAYGDDECAYCRMEISDPRFGTVVVTPKGRTLTFDSIECLADYVASVEARGGAGTAWVSDYAHPGTLVRADSAHFVRVRGPAGSPMGKGLVAVAGEADAAALRARLGGEALAWRDVVTLAAREGHGAAPRGVAAGAAPSAAHDAR